MNTGGSNGSNSEPTYSTDPSSDNSSIERAAPPQKQMQDLGEQYGFSGFGGGPQYQGPILEEFGSGPGPSSLGGHYPQQQYPTHSNIPPPVPTKKPLPPINTNINLNNQSGPPAQASRPNVLSRKSTSDEGKRKSWLKRRFSKNN